MMRRRSRREKNPAKAPQTRMQLQERGSIFFLVIGLHNEEEEGFETHARDERYKIIGDLEFFKTLENQIWGSSKLRLNFTYLGFLKP